MKIWITAFLSLFIGLPLAGLIQNDFLGYSAFSILLTAIFINISIFIRFLVKNRQFSFFKFLWIGFSLYILVFTIILKMIAFESNDLHIFYHWSLFILSFPSSIIATYILAIMIYFLSSLHLVPFYIDITLTWGIFFLIGYFQWFKLMPVLKEKFRQRFFQ